MQDLIALMFDTTKGVKHPSSSQSLGQMEVVTVTVTFEEEQVFPDLEIQTCFIHYR